MGYSGVYAIRHVLNGHMYIGSAANVRVRMAAHRRGLRGGYHINKHLQHAWDRYGEDAFKFIVLVVGVDSRDLVVLEQFYIDALRPRYNIRRLAGSNLGVRHSLETRAKISASLKGQTRTPEQRARIAASQTGKTLTPEHRARMSAAHQGRTFTPEHRANISAAGTGKHGGRRPNRRSSTHLV